MSLFALKPSVTLLPIRKDGASDCMQRDSLWRMKPMIKIHSVWIAANKNGIINSDACTEMDCKQCNMWPTYMHTNSLWREEKVTQMRIERFTVKTRGISQRHAVWFLVNYSNARNVIHCKEERKRRFICNVTHSTYRVIQEKSSIFCEVI